MTVSSWVCLFYLLNTYVLLGLISSSFYSLCNLSYDRSIAHPKKVLQIVRSVAATFVLKYLSLSLNPCSSCLRLIPLLLFSTLLHPFLPFCSTLPSTEYFSRQFLDKKSLIQLLHLRFILCRLFLTSFTLYNSILFHSPFNRSGWSSPSFLSVTFVHF